VKELLQSMKAETTVVTSKPAECFKGSCNTQLTTMVNQEQHFVTASFGRDPKLYRKRPHCF